MIAVAVASRHSHDEQQIQCPAAANWWGGMRRSRMQHCVVSEFEGFA
jgi:hypothetical protein